MLSVKGGQRYTKVDRDTSFWDDWICKTTIQELPELCFPPLCLFILTIHICQGRGRCRLFRGDGASQTLLQFRLHWILLYSFTSLLYFTLVLLMEYTTLLGRFPPSSASRAYYSTGRLAPCKLDLLLKLTPAPPARVNDADELWFSSNSGVWHVLRHEN